MQRAFFNLRLAANGSDLGQVKIEIVISVCHQLTEIQVNATGMNLRTSRGRIERLHLKTVPIKSERRSSGPRNWAKSVKPSFRPANCKIAGIALVQKRIVQIHTDIIRGEIKRNALVLPEQLALPDLELSRRYRKQPFQCGVACLSRGGLVRASVGIENDVNHRVLQDQRVKGQFCAQCRGQVDYSGQTVHMNVGLLAG